MSAGNNVGAVFASGPTAEARLAALERDFRLTPFERDILALVQTWNHPGSLGRDIAASIEARLLGQRRMHAQEVARQEIAVALASPLMPEGLRPECVAAMDGPARLGTMARVARMWRTALEGRE